MRKKDSKTKYKNYAHLLETGVVSKEFDAWLKKNDFFSAPASTHHHGAFKGGLIAHSEAVADILVEYTEKLGLKWQRPESPYIIGVFHDLCKVDNYIFLPEFSEHSSGYMWNDSPLIKGHGDKSIMLLAMFMTLTEEEVFCIRYHMGAYETENWEQFGKAVKLFPNVLYTHTADNLASKTRV